MSAGNSKFAMSRRTLLKAGAAICIFPAPHVLAQSAEQSELASSRCSLAPRRRRQAAGRGRCAVPQGAQRHDRRPQGRVNYSRYTGNPALAKTKLQSWSSVTGWQCRSARWRPMKPLQWMAMLVHEGAPLITTTSAATVDLKSHAVNPWVLHLRHGAAGHLSVGRLRGEDAWLQEIVVVAEDFTYGHEGAGDFSLALKVLAARLCRSYGAAQRTGTCTVLAAIKSDVMRSTWVLGAAIRCVPQAVQRIRTQGKSRRARQHHQRRQGHLQGDGRRRGGRHYRGLVRSRPRLDGQQEIRRRHQRGHKHDPGFYTAGPIRRFSSSKRR